MVQSPPESLLNESYSGLIIISWLFLLPIQHEYCKLFSSSIFVDNIIMMPMHTHFYNYQSYMCANTNFK